MGRNIESNMEQIFRDLFRIMMPAKQGYSIICQVNSPLMLVSRGVK